MLTGYLGARAKRSCLCLWRRSCGSSRGSELRGLSSSREARAASATASFVRRSCVAAWSDPARDNGGLHMPKVTARPLRSSSYRFPHASPVSTSGAGKQEAAPEDRFKPLISSRRFGAGEGIGEGLGLLENWLGCTLPESQQEGGLSVGAVGPQGASRWRDYPPRSVRARSFAP